MGLVSGVVTSLAFPPVDLGFLAFVGLVPLSIAFSRPGGRATFGATAGFGIGFFGFLIEWIRLFGYVAYVALFVQQVFMIVVGLLIARALLSKTTERTRRMLFPAAFLAVEYARSHVPYGGFPWGGIGYSQHDSAYLLEVAAYGGVWGVTFLVAAVSALGAELLSTLRPLTPRVGIPIVAAAALLSVPLLLPVADPNGETLRVAMVQGNTTEFVEDPHFDDETVLLNHVDLTSSIRKGSADLIVWPESSLGSDPFANPQYLDLITSAIQEQSVPFLIGATVEIPEAEQFLNTTLFMGSQGQLIDRYEKIRLVPFGEYVPFRQLLEPWVDELRRVPLDGVPGREHTVFDIPQGRIASVICFESTFPGFVREFVQRGAQFLIVSTNNSSFERSAASEQHLVFSQLRAAEHRVWVTHVALTGISAVIAPDGTVLRKTDLFEPALLQPEIRMSNSQTVYARWGDWLPFFAISLIVGVSLIGLITSRRRRTSA